MMIFEHIVPTLMIWTAIFAAAGVAGFSVWRYAPRIPAIAWIGALHMVFLGLLAWCLLIPGRKSVETRTLKPRFVVALDTSRSMLLSPVEGLSNRWDRVREILGMNWTESMAAECAIDLYPFASEVGRQMPLSDAATLEADGEATLLRDALQKITARYAGMNVAGGLLLSDGLDTREAFDEWSTEARPFKLYTVQLEPFAVWEVEPDLRVDGVQTPLRVTVNWKTELKAIVSGQGAPGAVAVQLFKEGVLQREMPIQIPADGGLRGVTFEVEHPEVGHFTYRVFVPPLTGESNTNDNEYAVRVQVIDAKNRLLYVDGTPRWESKYLRRALEANAKVAPLIFLQGPDGNPISFGRVGSMTPDMTEQQMAFFKIIVIGNLDAEELGERRAQALIRYVEAGGSLVLLGGTKAWGRDGFVKTSLKSILPVESYTSRPREGEYPVSLTDEGTSHPAFAGDAALWDIIPPVLSVFPNVVPARAARVLVVAQTPEGMQPIILSQRYGQGKVVAVFTDSLWKWQLHPDVIQNRPYQRFWDQLVAWLLPEEEEREADRISLFADREKLVLGEEVLISAIVGKEEDPQAQVRCEIELPKGDKAPFAMRPEPVTTSSGKTFPGYVTTFKATAPGMHTVTATALSGGQRIAAEPISFFVKPFSAESVPRAVNTAVLKNIAQSSGGRFFQTANALNDALSALTVSQIEEQTSEFRSLWQRWPVIACLMLLATVSWILRKVNNMP